jgi:hypothetical protein
MSITADTAKEYASILTQDFKHPFGALRAMLGTKLFILNDHGLRFDLHHAAHRVTLCDLDYDEGRDLFNLTFYKNKRFEGNVPVKTFSGLFCDQLKEVFEDYTKLRLTFPFRIHA